MPKEKIGQKMYRFVDGVLDQKRLLKVQNCDTYILIDEAGNRVKVNNDTYRSYTKLKEDAILNISLITSLVCPFLSKLLSNFIIRWAIFIISFLLFIYILYQKIFVKSK